MLKEVLKDIKPNKKEEKEISDKIKLFLDKLNSGLKDAKAVLGGSGAKGTWLKDAHDADVFVQFDYDKYKDKSDSLSDILEKHLKKKFKISRLHGSRDYFQVKDKNYTFEVVPVLKITNAKQAMNITDVSLLHSDWVRKHKRYADDIRLCKQFCKSNDIYGAESYIKGFSGYICEILTIHYKGFLNLIKNAAKWDGKIIIDTEKYYKNKNDVLFNINKSKQISPLIVIDPVQRDRNAAAALSEEKYASFISACKEFLKKKSEEFFKIKEITINDLRKKAGKNKLIVLNVIPLSGKQDVVGSKLLKAFEFIFNGLIKNDFKVFDYGWNWDKEKKAVFWYMIDKKDLDKTVERKGPPIDMIDAVKNFKKKHKKTSLIKGYIYSEEKREFVKAENIVKVLIKKDYFKEKIKSVSVQLVI